MKVQQAQAQLHKLQKTMMTTTVKVEELASQAPVMVVTASLLSATILTINQAQPTMVQSLAEPSSILKVLKRSQCLTVLLN